MASLPARAQILSTQGGFLFDYRSTSIGDQSPYIFVPSMRRSGFGFLGSFMNLEVQHRDLRIRKQAFFNHVTPRWGLRPRSIMHQHGRVCVRKKQSGARFLMEKIMARLHAASELSMGCCWAHDDVPRSRSRYRTITWAFSSSSSESPSLPIISSHTSSSSARACEPCMPFLVRVFCCEMNMRIEQKGGRL